MRRIQLMTAILLLAGLLAAGCKEEAKTIRIAEQYGLAYAPLQVMKEGAYLEEILGDEYTVEWVKLANTAAIREAMLGDGLDVGFMGIPPFLIGVENGMEWKIMTGLSKSPLGLVVNDASITTLEQLKDAGKIALPQPGSIQHILLSMAAGRELGDSKALDNQLVSMKHPDGAMALNSGTEIIGHFTSPPYLFRELENPDNRLLVSGAEAFGGEFTFIVGACREDFHADRTAYEGFLEALEMSIDKLNAKDEKTIDMLAKSYEVDIEILMSYLDQAYMEYGTDVVGTNAFSAFMYQEGYLKELIEEKDVIWNDEL